MREQAGLYLNNLLSFFLKKVFEQSSEYFFSSFHDISPLVWLLTEDQSLYLRGKTYRSAHADILALFVRSRWDLRLCAFGQVYGKIGSPINKHFWIMQSGLSGRTRIKIVCFRSSIKVQRNANMNHTQVFQKHFLVY